MTHGPADTRVQSLVYAMDQGRGRRLIRALMVILLVIGLSGAYVWRGFKGLKNTEAMDQAQVALNLARKAGYSSRVLRPLGIWQISRYVERETGQRISGEVLTQWALSPRETLHPPMYPVLLAGPFRLLNAVNAGAFTVPGGGGFRPGRYPPEVLVMIPIGLASVLAASILVFRIAKLLLDDRAAWLAFFLFLATNAVWAIAVSGRSMAVLMLAATFTLYLLVHADLWHQDGHKGFWKWAFLVVAGGVTGLGFLTRYSYGLVLPAMLIWALFAMRGRRWPALIALVLPFMAVAVPWCVWLWRQSGSPFGIAPYTIFLDTSGYPEDFVLRTLQFDASKVAVTQVGQKVLTNLREFFSTRILMVGGNLVAMFFIVAALHRFRRGEVRRVNGLVWTVFFLFVFAEAFTEADPHGLAMLLFPAMTVFAAGMFLLLLDRARIQLRVVRATATVAFVMVNTVGLAVTLVLPREGMPYPPYWPPMIRFLGSTLRPGEVMMSDIPEGVAWYGARRCVPLSPDVDEFYGWHDFVLPGRLKALYLTTETRNRPFLHGLVKGPMKSWGEIVAIGRVPADFPFYKTIAPMDNQDQLFLSDTERWRTVAAGAPVEAGPGPDAEGGAPPGAEPAAAPGGGAS